MKMVGWLATMALAATPVAVAAHGGGIGGGMGGAHAGMGGVARARVGPGWGGSAWRGRGFASNHGPHDHLHGHFNGHFHDRHFHDHAFAWGYPYWGWECGPDGDSCDWSDDSDVHSPDPAYAGRKTAADPPAAAAASNECSDWVWRADLRRSICRGPTSRG